MAFTIYHFTICFVGVLAFQMVSVTCEDCYSNGKMMECMEDIDYSVMGASFDYAYDSEYITWTIDGDLGEYQDELCEVFQATVDCGAQVSEECKDFMISEGESVTFKDSNDLAFSLAQC